VKRGEGNVVTGFIIAHRCRPNEEELPRFWCA
jgi:hypothetical protein